MAKPAAGQKATDYTARRVYVLTAEASEVIGLMLGLAELINGLRDAAG